MPTRSNSSKRRVVPTPATIVKWCRPLLTAISFHSDNEALQPLLQAVDLIRRYVDQRCTYYRDDDEVPLQEVESDAWNSEVLSVNKRSKRRVNRISYELCAFQTLREQLRCRAVWVVGANRYRNSDEDLRTDFNKKRDLYYEALQQPQDAQTFTARLRQEMVDALSTLNAGLPHNAWLTLDAARKHPLKLSSLPAQADPVNIAALKHEIQQQWPMTALLGMLEETDLHTNFTDRFQAGAVREHLSAETLRKRLLLCLYALGTNTGYQRIGHEATSDALRHIRRRYITRQNLRQAIAAVVNAIFEARLPHIWGEATTACASDSKKFVAWDQNLLTEWHVRYRGPRLPDCWPVARSRQPQKSIGL